MTRRDARATPEAAPAGTRPVVHRAFLSVLMVVLSACNGASRGEQNPFPWNPGHYTFSGSYSYRNDMPQSESTERRSISGRVIVGSDGPISVETPMGACITPTLSRQRADEAAGTRSFQCGDALLIFRRQRSNIGVSAWVAVQISTLRRGECAEYQIDRFGNRQCVRYNYFLDRRTGSASTNIRSVVRQQGEPETPRVAPTGPREGRRSP
jgi:hypothetical protein